MVCAVPLAQSSTAGSRERGGGVLTVRRCCTLRWGQLLLRFLRWTRLLAFARVTWVTPRVAYLADVIVSPEARGKGLGKALMARVMNHPRLRKTPKVILHTKDAQSFYAQFGFREKHGDENSFMQRQLH